jgi:hypothetical protein
VASEIETSLLPRTSTTPEINRSTGWIAVVYAALGDTVAAFAELEKSYQQREWFFPLLKTDPFMDPLRSDPRLWIY